MATLRILSAGAAQAVVEKTMDAFRKATGHEAVADCGAVGAMRAKVLGGEPVDVIVLTRAMIDELTQSGHVTAGSAHDLGRVGTGLAVRAGAPRPAIGDRNALRASLLAAGRIVFPDPGVATAGKVIMAMLDKLAITDEVKSKLQFFPNGYAAMGWLGREGSPDAIGMTQDTEIIPNTTVTYVGPLPDEFQMKTVYTIGAAAKAAAPELARDFIARLSAASARPMLQAAGYELV